MNPLRNRVDWALTTDFDDKPPPNADTMKAVCWLILVIIIIGVLAHA